MKRGSGDGDQILDGLLAGRWCCALGLNVYRTPVLRCRQSAFSAAQVVQTRAGRFGV